MLMSPPAFAHQHEAQQWRLTTWSSVVGAVGMAFVDTLLDESDAHITIVDRHGKPGGHWNRCLLLRGAAPAVGLLRRQLHRVGKPAQGRQRAQRRPVRTGGRVRDQCVLRQGHAAAVPAERPRQLPPYERVHRRGADRLAPVRGANPGRRAQEDRLDSTAFCPRVPATHTPKFSIADGVRVVPPNVLPQLWMHRTGEQPAQQFCILAGPGSTVRTRPSGCCAAAAAPQSIQWVVPRDSLAPDRLHTQPGLEFFEDSMGGEADKLAAFE